MNRSEHVSAVVLAVSVCLFLAGGAFAQSGNTGAAGVDNLFLAKDDGTGKPGDPAEWFYSTDVPIYVVVMFEPAKPAAITMRFVSVSVPGLKPESKILSTNYDLKEGNITVWFNGRPFGSYWIAGKYRVDIFVDGKLNKSQEFEIKKADAPQKASTFAPTRTKPKKLPRKHWSIIN